MRAKQSGLFGEGWCAASVVGLALLACNTQTETALEVVTELRALSPALADEAPAPPWAPRSNAAPPAQTLSPPAPPSDPSAPRPTRPQACREVERQARAQNDGLPKPLDTDTRLTRVWAHDCDVVIDYELATLAAAEVDPNGVEAMRERVVCADRGALAVLQQGGTFTNAYYDRVHAPIGRFTVAAGDCQRVQ
jgi:hypothetical protein